MQLPLPAKIALIGLVLAGGYLVGPYQSRLRSNAVLENYAASHPEHAELALAIVACNSELVVNVERCGAKLIARFGDEELLKTMADMAAAGAFGDARQL